ncbi:MAG: helix-turn-helix transcriptional regulator [Lachnospiraceae bacterium]|nr:helix-turn-helix transcriptional regulator [Lachnospiraceae bacterium]
MGVSFGEKIKSARKAKGLTQKQLAAKINAAHNSISDWENDKNKPDPDTIELLCGVLEITPNYLLAASPDDFSPKDKLLVRRYNDLDSIGQSHVDSVLQWETERVQQIEQAASTVVEVADSDSQGRVLQYFHSVSAGAGEVLFDDVYTERITVPNKPQYHRVAYAVKVSGHSMEPLYHDKDILLVEPTCEISVGEIGIFNVNGQAYVKKLGKGKLISLNKGYDDIPLTEESLCMGRVVDSLKS